MGTLNNTNVVLVIATPHARYQKLEGDLRSLLPTATIHWIREREKLEPAALKSLAPDWIFFPHWSWKIPETIYEGYRCVIFHMTDLPYGRGGSPLQNLIVRGHRSTQLTALRCTAELDAGAIYLKRPLSLEGTAEEILIRAAALMPNMITEIVTGNLEPTPQTGEPVAFARRRPEDSNLASLETLAQVYDYIRMLDGEGYPPAFLEIGRLRIEFTEASLLAGEIHAQARITVSP